ncbi:putative peptide-modifying radical SAM enzyme, AF0577 family [Caldisphaera lagunensis DSM 15908]|uniref:Putative peptide-modifying radical SAM enzyme, AF0577 family n=1 Tax=Caldisphaera lagunensis (strain DSM 15908 / JCM 11604 / ANMR 0165 / IC-154) TaxID=1056495 RepID=L0AD20_CALLD|nr:putative peptide-modifying radical SAM enzyme, AF0577 family [Caldisphaera lagunensis DSM 15908]
MLWLIITTGKCNLKCDYCGGSYPNKFVPWNIKYDIEKLKELILKDNFPTVIFYGGEPLLNYKYIMNVMDNIKKARFGIQTNGLLVKLLPEEYWKRINVALLSIDGREEINDKHRGKGAYNKVINAVKYLKEINPNIETIARMTVTKDSDIYEEVMHLIKLKLFDKIHWQLDVIWDEKWDFNSWAENSYLPGLKKLMEYFLDGLRNGRLIKIIPFLGILSAHYHQGFIGYPCGAGYKSVTVSSDGRILSCPIAVRENWSVLGYVNKGFNLIKDPLPDYCKNCDLKRYCGGRCLYMHMEPYWGKEGFISVDNINKKYIKMVLSIIPEVDNLIKNGIISLDSLYYDPTLDSTEVIP